MSAPNPPTCWPILNYADAPAAIRFLVDAFGFEEALVVPDEAGGVAHAELRWPLGGGVMLGSAGDGNEWQRMAIGQAGVYVVCDEPDALFERASAAGATVLHEPVDQEYGSREFAVRDPEGNQWSFGTYRGA